MSSARPSIDRPSRIITPHGIYEVTLVVTDSDGLAAVSATTADIGNLPPTSRAGGPYAGLAGQPIALSGAGDDPSSIDAAGLAFS